MPEFPMHQRDVSTFASFGVHLSTPSDTAAKMYDALVAQAIYHYNDESLGGFSGTMEKMFQADPDFAMGNIFNLGLECFVSNPTKKSEPRKKLIDFSARAKSLKLTPQEQKHLKAAEALSAEDWLSAMAIFESILVEAPLDTYALHMAYFLALTSGSTTKLRDIPASVIKEYKPGMPYYGHVHGKLCFGQGENGEYEKSELNGRLALDHMPLDNWSHHALSHNFEETGRSLQGKLFLDNTQPQWELGTTFSHHLHWHHALFNVYLGDFEAALTMYDNFVGPMGLKDGGSFPLSDGSSLLYRLKMEGVDTGDRIQEQAKAWTQHTDNCVSLFYDGHHCFSSLMAGDKAAAEKLKDSMREYIAGDRQGHNKEVTAKVGIPLLEGITAFSEEEYEKAVDILQPIMPELLSSIQGSGAQKSIFRTILLEAAFRSGNPKNLQFATNTLDTELKDKGLDTHGPVNIRFLNKMMAVHETQG